MSVISRIGSNIGTLAARATGLVSLGMVAYDAHVLGKLGADTYSQSNEADRLAAAANNISYLEAPSAVMGKVKKKIFNFQVENNIFMPFEAVWGYFKSFGYSCLNSIIPLGLGITALFGAGKKVPCLSALGLILYGGFKVIKDGFGLGRPDRINPSYKD